VVTSFLDPVAIAAVHEAVQRGFQTTLDLQDEPLLVTFRATAHATGTVTVDTDRRVALSLSGNIPSERLTEGAQSGVIRGELRAWAPWGVAPDWTFVLPSGQGGRVVAVPPPKYGIQRAVIEVED
jgi:hypothetical protein